jgi:hypothetical protein
LRPHIRRGDGWELDEFLGDCQGVKMGHPVSMIGLTLKRKGRERSGA